MGLTIPHLGILLGESQLRSKGNANVVTHRPGHGCAWNFRHGIEHIVAAPGIGAFDDLPTAAIPLLDERLSDLVAVEVEAHRPDIVAGERYHSDQLVNR